MKDLELVEKLSQAIGPSGFEDDVLAVCRKYCEEFATFEEDSMRNLYIYLKDNQEGRPTMMMDAHADEVGFMVQAIRPDGALKFIPIGGWNDNTLPSSKVQIKTKKGVITGCVASIPPHFLSADQRGASVSMSNMVIDIGAVSDEDAKNNFGVAIGDIVVPKTFFEYDEKNDIIQGKAFDDRIGVACMLRALKELYNKPRNVNVVGVVSSQEEVGERGAMCAVRHVKPDIALCFEGGPADDTFSPSYMVQDGLKRGTMLRYMDRTVICTPRYMDFAIRVAEEKKIKYQLAVRSGGGNNGAVIVHANEGIPVIVACVPVRYIHTFNCFATMQDFYACSDLGVAVCQEIDEKTIQSF